MEVGKVVTTCSDIAALLLILLLLLLLLRLLWLAAGTCTVMTR